MTNTEENRVTSAESPVAVPPTQAHTGSPESPAAAESGGSAAASCWTGGSTTGSSPPTIRTFSCGAGVQSTAIALLMRDGRLPLVDHVIFADTGWEPASVYGQVDRLAAVFAELGVSLHRVTAGNLRADSIDRSGAVA